MDFSHLNKDNFLMYAIKEIEELKLFKTKAVTIFAVVQFIMVSLLAYSQVL